MAESEPVAEAFLADIEAFLHASGMAPARLGREAVNDPGLVFDLRAGSRSPGADLMDRVRAWMSGNRPNDGLAGRTVLLVIGGGIAAYKALDVIRRLQDAGAAVRVIMTRAAHEFVTPLAAGALAGGHVYTDLFDRADEHDVGHIRLAREADLVVVAPATADRIARLATGRSDDLTGAVVLATRAPVLLAPAMNPAMWTHPATRANVATLSGLGVRLVGPRRGEMAEKGEAGLGRMAEPTEIVAAASRLLSAGTTGPLAGRRVVVTSGPTHEPIDPVRYIANRSSGRQGHAIAAAAAAAGAEVTLVTGPVTLGDPPGVTTIHVETARQMLDAVETALPADVAIMVAAVADWRVSEPADAKLKKDGSGAPPALAFVENPDILATIGHRETGRPRLVVGFAAETGDLVRYGQDKLKRKRADWIVANDVSPEGGAMGGNDNEVVLITREGTETWPRMSKAEVADRLVARMAETLRK